jgi:hypothetical protein
MRLSRKRSPRLEPLEGKLLLSGAGTDLHASTAVQVAKPAENEAWGLISGTWKVQERLRDNRQEQLLISTFTNILPFGPNCVSHGVVATPDRDTDGKVDGSFPVTSRETGKTIEITIKGEHRAGDDRGRDLLTFDADDGTHGTAMLQETTSDGDKSGDFEITFIKT